LRERATLLLLGGFYSAAVELAEIGELFAFEPLVALALERAILLRKNNIETAAASLTPFPHTRVSVPPSVRGSEALVKALHQQGSLTPSRAPAAPSPKSRSSADPDPDSR
jgi:hypothetical protein